VKSAAFTSEVGERLTWDKFGLRVAANSPALARRFGLASAEGVVVVEILRGGPAHRRDFRPGDVILQVNSLPTPDEAAFHRAMGRTLWQRSVMVNVLRGPHSYWAPLDAGG
jgi:S1-C subfamily serine protease